jgi:hypothetical protein
VAGRGGGKGEAEGEGVIETWEEHRAARSGFGRLAKWVFVGFNLWIAVEVVFALSRIGEARSAVTGGLGKAIVGNAGQAVLIEWLAVWMVGFVVLGWAVLATRGKRVMVRREMNRE